MEKSKEDLRRGGKKNELLVTYIEKIGEKKKEKAAKDEEDQLGVKRAGLAVALPTWTSSNSRRRSRVSSFSFNVANLLLVVASK